MASFKVVILVWGLSLVTDVAGNCVMQIFAREAMQGLFTKLFLHLIRPVSPDTPRPPLTPLRAPALSPWGGLDSWLGIRFLLCLGVRKFLCWGGKAEATSGPRVSAALFARGR